MKDLSLHILDIAQNAIRAKADSIEITINEQLRENQLTISIQDNGHGMSQSVLEKVMDPFYTTRTTRKVGMGIPLFKQNAELAGGGLSITSKEGSGTIIQAHFLHNHLDRPALGDIAGVVCLLIQANPEIRFRYQHQTDTGSYTVDTKEIQESLGDSPIQSHGINRLIKEMIIENLKEIKISQFYS